MVQLSEGWQRALADEFHQPYYVQLRQFLKEAYSRTTVFPPKAEVLNALYHTPLEHVKVLILGQDPYHDDGQAHGLAFSVKPGQKVPPSLNNIFLEMKEDVGCAIPNHGCLKAWADQGVLLLNTVLTVEAHKPNAHKGMGWERFTDTVIQVINIQDRPIVIFLWGRPAQQKAALLNNPKHLVLKAPHPSPLSAYRGFFGCKCFSRCNAFLMSHGVTPIDWQLKDIGF